LHPLLFEGARGTPAGHSRCCCGAVADGVTDKASQKFISSAIQGDIAEVDFGKLAQEKGQSDAVKQYGAMLVKDHGDHKTKAEQVASELGVTPPTGSGIGAKATYAKLKILSGASFDRSFAKSMVKDHQEDIKEYRQEATKADTAGRLAKETLPILQKHLQEAQSLEKQTAQKQSSR
jgi:putative membrane protein